MSEQKLAAVIYAEGQGPRMDDMLIEVVKRLRQDNLRLAGAVQHNTDDGDRCRCDMTLEDLTSGRHIDISEKRGPEAQGCRLDSFALEESVGLVAEALASAAPDLLIVNRYGKREAEGHGFRQAIEQAMSDGVAVLVAVSNQQRAAWEAFASPYSERLNADIDQIVAWCRQQGHKSSDDAVAAIGAAAQ